jgi:hypothetical protein
VVIPTYVYGFESMCYNLLLKQVENINRKSPLALMGIRGRCLQKLVVLIAAQSERI